MLNKTIECLSQLVQQLPKDKAYMQWIGQLFDDDNHFARYDKVEMLLVYWRKDRPVYRRIPACLTKNGNREPQLLFTTAPLVRITEGPRSNRVLPDEDILSTEQCESAGIYKRLSLGANTNEFSPLRHKDVKYGESLQQLCNDIQRDDLKTTLDTPATYLTCRGDGSHFLRVGSEDWYESVTNGLTEFNINKLPREEIINAGGGRMGLPFEHVYGKGVVALDPLHMGYWRCISLYDLNCTKPHLRVSVQ
jgi:hypothetical protein